MKTINNTEKITAMKITFLIAAIYFILGNVVGYIMCTGLISSDNILTNIFFPYTITWGLSAMVGADLLTFIFIAIAFAVSFCIFFPIGFYLSQRIQKRL
ncbi:MAG: hypothetical protein ABIQ27_03340 [Flavobacterium sp.]|uniref:hypothetical protein n=1 Tax=Flavobacterium sp. TaxID=239 RepID=UPI003267EB32